MIDRSILKQALAESTLTKIRAIKNSKLPYIETDRAYDERIINLLQGPRMVSHITLRNQIRIGIIAAILACAILIMSISAVDSRRVKDQVNVYKNHIVINMQHNNSSNDEMKIYMPTFVPEGYELKAVFKDEKRTAITWFNGLTKINLSQKVIRNGFVDITTDKPGFEVIEMGELTLYYSDYYNFERSVIWIVDEYVFSIKSDTSVSRSDILKMVETMGEYKQSAPKDNPA